MQFIGPQLNDTNVIKLASAFDKKVNFSKKIPPAFDKEI
jgi:Asp-tRNA(Asn)/Glu-tRNA(Gln) amidotransferase A subunit family amidase